MIGRSGWRGMPMQYYRPDQRPVFNPTYPPPPIRPREYHKPKQVEIIKMNEFGYALWCHPGAHAFDPLDTHKKKMTEDIEKYDEDGALVRVTQKSYFICGEHRGRIFQAPANAPKELTEKGTKVDGK